MARTGKPSTYHNYVATLIKSARRVEVKHLPQEFPFHISGIPFSLPEKDDQGKRARIAAFCSFVRPHRLALKCATGESVLLDMYPLREAVLQLLQCPEAVVRRVRDAVDETLHCITNDLGGIDVENFAEFQAEFMYWYFFDPLVKARGEEAACSEMDSTACDKLAKRRKGKPTSEVAAKNEISLETTLADSATTSSLDAQLSHNHSIDPAAQAPAHEARSVRHPELPKELSAPHSPTMQSENPVEDQMVIQRGETGGINWAEESEKPYLMDFTSEAPPPPARIGSGPRDFATRAAQPRTIRKD
eukprot:TRINITY_DN890_c0_g2_i1.p1 TRINITY_DN890_c0_g2~~TRINITY_DN890_c0_g2_i1.p1  ORF type:complete len:323 (+),score=51.54 TRINITY_DN890_c0_g2_i1:61-969(+)